MGKFTDAGNKLTEGINSHNVDAATNAYAADAVAYDPMYPEPLRGRDAIRKDTATFLRAFPDLRFEIVTIVEKDERNGAAEMRMTSRLTRRRQSAQSYS